MAPLRLAIAALAVVALLTAPSAQTPVSPQPPPRPTFRVEANFVRVDAYPTAGGRPVEDLTAADFELLENGEPQAIETFERIVVPLPGPQTERIEPNTVRDSRAMAADARARLFVVFLDSYHVNYFGSHQARAPLVRLLDRLIGEQDLVAVMTPEMPATGIAFARKTGTIEGMLARHWTWGRRDAMADKDPEEIDYEACYPDEPGVVAEMIRRRREKLTLGALADLVVHLRGLRDERKAVLAVSGGWTLPRPDDALMSKPRGDAPLGLPPVRVGIDGRLTTRDDRSGIRSRSECDVDRMRLAQLDLYQTFLDVLDAANRGNATFYPINPQGLEAGATPAQVDWIIRRTDSLKILADNTDGVAIVNTNNLTGAMPRIVNDLSAYYLLGYYSSIGKLDGSFRRITVRVKRPGVSVRARRGYRAATIAEVSAAATAAGGSRVDGAIADAIGVLSRVGRGQPLRVAAAMAADGSAVWVTGELDPSRLRAEFRSGGEAVILLSEPNGPTTGQAKVPVPAGRRSFTARIGSLSLRAGRYEVMVRASAAGAAPLLESASVTFTPGALGTALLFRRGPLTTQPFEPVADPQFRRTDTLRVQVPVAAAPLDARITLLDRNGQPLHVSMTLREIEEVGVRWIVGDLPLASLAAGDYVVQIEAGGEKRATAFRVAA